MVADYQIVLLLVLPLISAALITFFFRKLHKIAVGISVFSSMACAAIAFIAITTWNVEPVHREITWLTFGSLNITLGYYLNSTSAVLLFVVTFVGFLIHLFAVEYSEHDESRARFFGALSLFMFSMTGIVLSSNLIMMFFFWELVGFCSYMLIGHYQFKDSAGKAANKAFIVNRIGDFGFLIGIIWCWWQYGTVDLVALEAQADTLVTGIGLLLFCGVLGKSAQMPLHVWLPDAMEGPTPVSALIHAATMVAAGVFLMCRVFFIFSVEALDIIAWVGAITAIFAGISAITQNDIKKILAYSTLSQLGYMVAAFAIGTIAAHGDTNYGVGAALFHLTTHAFFKALLFLGAGSIIHATHHEQNIFKMGGLAARMPITFVTFSIGYLALTGFPLLSGFWSKESILAVAQEENAAIFYILLIGAGVTAFYMTRLWIKVFLGTPKTDYVAEAKETSWVMTLPLIILSVFALLAGYQFIYPAGLVPALHGSIPHPEGAMKMWLPIISIAVAVVGYILAALLYRANAEKDFLEDKLPAVFKFINARLWFDEIYAFYVNRIQQPIANAISLIDLAVIGGLGMRGSAGGVGLLGLIVRMLTTGSVHHYVYWFAVGLILCGAVVFGFAK